MEHSRSFHTPDGHVTLIVAHVSPRLETLAKVALLTSSVAVGQ